MNLELYNGGAMLARMADAFLEWVAGVAYGCAVVVGPTIDYGIYAVGPLVIAALGDSCGHGSNWLVRMTKLDR